MGRGRGRVKGKWGLADIARRVIHLILNPRVLSEFKGIL
jgi:hypothetical protein